MLLWGRGNPPNHPPTTPRFSHSFGSCFFMTRSSAASCCTCRPWSSVSSSRSAEPSGAEPSAQRGRRWRFFFWGGQGFSK